MWAHLIVEAARQMGPKPGAMTEVCSGGNLACSPAQIDLPILCLRKLHIPCHMRHLQHQTCLYIQWFDTWAAGTYGARHTLRPPVVEGMAV